MRFISAHKIVTITQGVLNKGLVVVDDNGEIKDVLDSEHEIDPLKIETHEGIICPGFINTHCHLELSHLHHQLGQKTGIVNFAKELISKRFSADQEYVQACIKKADEEMWKNGIVAVGDISNDESSFDVKADSGIQYHTFIELLALHPERAEMVMNYGTSLEEKLKAKNLRASLSPHAPYSVSSTLLKLMGAYAGKNKQVVSMHNQESIAEDDFIRNKKGDFLKLYEFLKIPIDYYEPTGLSALKASLSHLKNNNAVLLVHNTFTSDEDIQWALKEQEKIYWCLCPNANLYIEGRLPDVYQFIKQGCKMTIGTDSLASNHQLCILSELKLLAKNFPALNTIDLLQWACLNGAELLGLEKVYGSIEKGKRPGLNLITSTQEESLTAESKIIKLI